MITFQPTSVNQNGLTALIRNLGRDCPPSQYLREFLKNSIEACQRTAEPNCQISLDFNHNIHQKTGYFKIAFTDNGDGMSPEQMLNLLNNLSASGSVTNEYVNYGVGAKISAMTRNHIGIQYESWQNGVGYSVLIRYKAEEDIFGVQGFLNNQGEVVYALPLDNQNKPEIINQHGTRVTLFGMTEDQDTMTPPQGIGGSRERWMIDYLNARFFTLPPNISINTRVGYFQPIEDPTKNYIEPVIGFKQLIDKHSFFKGHTRVSNATIYWWIVIKDGPVRGHTALINQGEIFDISDARSNRSSHFGIVVGRDQIVIYVEPDNAVQNTPRTTLLNPDGSQIDCSLWQDEFRENMPEIIRNFIDSLLNETSQVSHVDKIARRLNALKALFLMGGYQELVVNRRKQKSQETNILPEELIAGISEEYSIPPDEIPEQPLHLDLESESSDPDVNYFPIVEWTNEERSPQLIARAAEYIQATNTVLANRDFKGVKDLINFFMERYNENEELTKLITSLVTETVEQALMECVAGALSFKGDPHWNGHHVHLALTPEALTTALMQRYWISSYIDQQIKQHLISV